MLSDTRVRLAGYTLLEQFCSSRKTDRERESRNNSFVVIMLPFHATYSNRVFSKLLKMFSIVNHILIDTYTKNQDT